MNILVIAAHPDDEVLGCGGAIARLATEGHAVSILILGEGSTARADDPTKANARERNALHATAQRVGKFLGAKEVLLSKFPDNRFDTIPLLTLTKVVEEQIARLHPTVVYTQHGGDLNVDHARTFRSVLTATRPMEEDSVKKILAFEVGSSTEWAFQQFEPVFRPSVFVDIGATLEKKIEAMTMYRSEARPFPHPRSGEAIRANAHRWGSSVGLRAAEAFSLVWSRE